MPESLRDAESMVRREYTGPTALTGKAIPKPFRLLPTLQNASTPTRVDAQRVRAMIAIRKPQIVEPSETLAEKFQRLRAQWLRESKFMSRTKDIVNTPSYRRVLAMGPAVVPLIMRDLRHRPLWWFDALEAITDANPVAGDHEGNVNAIAGDWLKWWESEGQRWKTSG